MANIPQKAVFVDNQAIGLAAAIEEAIAVQRRHARRKYPGAAVRLLVTELGVEHPERWLPEEHLSESRTGFYFDVRLLKGDHP